MRNAGEMEGAPGVNPYTKNLKRFEFLITFACTGRCRHCSEGDHETRGAHIDGAFAARAVGRLCSAYGIESLMTFAGAPLLYVDEACRLHAAARAAAIPGAAYYKRFFQQRRGKNKGNGGKPRGVNDLLLSVHAFHQETIPLGPVKAFADAARAAGIPLRTHPAWLVDQTAENPWNARTLKILGEFEAMGIAASRGNVVFPGGNALKYLHEYFDSSPARVSPYAEDPEDIRALCASPEGNVLGGTIYRTDILDIIEHYAPYPGG